jgi:hypothetical protein
MVSTELKMLQTFEEFRADLLGQAFGGETLRATRERQGYKSSSTSLLEFLMSRATYLIALESISYQLLSGSGAPRVKMAVAASAVSLK